MLRIIVFTSLASRTRKKFVLAELPNSSSETEDMRKIRYILPNSTVNILTKMCSQTSYFTVKFGKIYRIFFISSVSEIFGNSFRGSEVFKMVLIGH